MNNKGVLIMVAVVALFVAAVLPVSYFFRGDMRNFDENREYFPNVEVMAAKFPKMDLLEDSMTSSPPGYFHLMAGIVQVTGTKTFQIRLNHLLLSLAWMLISFALLLKFAKRGAWSFIPFLPLFLGNYYIKQSMLFGTDNVALGLSVIVLTLLIFSKRDLSISIVIGIVILFALYCRQTTIWLLAPLMTPFLLEITGIKRGGINWKFGVVAIVVSVISLAILSMYYLTWGGLLPPLWQTSHKGWSLTAPLYGMALFGVLAPLFIRWKTSWTAGTGRWIVIFAVIAGTLLFLVAPSDFNYKAGRWGLGFWNIAQVTPAIAERSLMFYPLVVWGFFCFGLLGQQVWNQSRVLAFQWGIAFCAWMASTIPNSHIFHRYFEGYILIFLGFAAVIAIPESKIGRAKIYVLTGLLLFAGLAGLYFGDNGFREGAIIQWRH